MFDAGSLSQHSPGITYIIQLPNLDIKIGTTKDGKSLSRRLMSLGRQFRGRPTLLATLVGGETQEAVLHARFAEHRRYDKLDERFRPAAEIFFFAKEVGLEEEGKLGLQAFESWQYVPGTVVEPRDDDRKYLAVSCADCGAEENEPCMWKTETIEAIHASRKSRLSYLLMP
ncbi:GIY-YIG nuclease family protein [Micromonospora sp. C72]|uniref:GIY-YIG nuclease family protein n=1 Tax=Micromonospora sp. C72 TaxID=2824880 RepID=UPI001B37D2A7|nr:GIY-YIG nuclease family protein [Micromonospora sp. C72]MBQ1045323.1 GIY-YIG nuclease family protein [Micromonospora sp. C72]